MRAKAWRNEQILRLKSKFSKMINCIRSGDQLKVDEMMHSSDSLATRDYSASGFSSRTGEVEPKVDNANIEEAESSLRESGYLNYEVCLSSIMKPLFYGKKQKIHCVIGLAHCVVC